MLQMVRDPAATSVNKVFRTIAVLGCGKKLEKLPQFYCSGTNWRYLRVHMRTKLTMKGVSKDLVKK